MLTEPEHQLLGISFSAEAWDRAFEVLRAGAFRA
jgi:hypothetical protein